MASTRITPSILSADFARLGEEVRNVVAAGADWIHVDVMDKLDLILIMSVNPGFGGQKFIPGALEKLRQARARIDASGRAIRLEIDGGVTAQNIGAIAAAGADTFVAGSAIFHAADYATEIAAMRKAIG
jgi:ribulose-phosphate 3-epimerase